MKSAIAVLGAACFMALPSPAAALKPFVLPPLWAEPEATNARSVPKAATAVGPPCRLAVSPLTDTRAEPELLGTVNGHQLRPPADRAAWLASMIAGLNRRGMDVTLNDLEGMDGASSKGIGITLQSAWVDSYEGGFTGMVAFELNSNDDANLLRRRVVGRATTTDFIGAAHVRANIAFQRAVGRALDAMVPLLNEWCHARGR